MRINFKWAPVQKNTALSVLTKKILLDFSIICNYIQTGLKNFILEKLGN
jgi:hypothetical protein